MIPDETTVLEYLPNSPCVVERFVLPSQSPIAVLKRILHRLGLTPLRVGLRRGDQEKTPGEVLIIGRVPGSGEEQPYARILWGLDFTDLDRALTALIEADWKPTSPKFDMTLPDGRDV